MSRAEYKCSTKWRSYDELEQQVKMLKKQVIACHMAEYKILEVVVHAIKGLPAEKQDALFQDLFEADEALRELRSLPSGLPPRE